MVLAAGLVWTGIVSCGYAAMRGHTGLLFSTDSLWSAFFYLLAGACAWGRWQGTSMMMAPEAAVWWWSILDRRRWVYS